MCALSARYLFLLAVVVVGGGCGGGGCSSGGLFQISAHKIEINTSSHCLLLLLSFRPLYDFAMVSSVVQLVC